MKQYAVYFVTNWTNEVLYTGVTSELEKRISQHKNKTIKGFTARYNAHKLVYYELFNSVEAAILREKQIKKWRRDKKDFLVQQINPEWRDLSEERTITGPSASLRSARDDNKGKAA